MKLSELHMFSGIHHSPLIHPTIWGCTRLHRKLTCMNTKEPVSSTYPGSNPYVH